MRNATTFASRIAGALAVVAFASGVVAAGAAVARQPPDAGPAPTVGTRTVPVIRDRSPVGCN